MIEAQANAQGLQVTDGFPQEAKQNRPAESNVTPGIYLAPIRKVPKVYKSQNINAYYVLMAEFQMNGNGELEPKSEDDANGVKHQCVRQVYPSLFAGEIGTIIVDAADPEIQRGVGPRKRPQGAPAQLFSKYMDRDAGMAALYDRTHQDTTNPSLITDCIYLASAEDVWTINRNRVGAGANTGRNVQRKVYTSEFVKVKTPVEYIP